MYPRPSREGSTQGFGLSLHHSGNERTRPDVLGWAPGLQWPLGPPLAAQLALILFLSAATASAQSGGSETRLALSFAGETGYSAGLRVPAARGSNLGIAQGSFAWRQGGRWRFAASAAAFAAGAGETHGRLLVKETYLGFTAGDFDFLAGKRILKWGTGYAFTPTGVLDPPRDPADPTDRLGLNQGRELASIEYIRGRHAITAAWASGGMLQRHRPGLNETFALRDNFMIAGFDASVIFAQERGRQLFAGANFTRVVGEAVEIHAEVAHREATAVLAGGKYSFLSGAGAIAELYFPGAGQPPHAFVHLGKSRLRELPGWKEWDIGGALLLNLRDRSRLVILDVNRRFGNRLSAYGRVQAPAGAKWRSEYGMIPYAALLTAGFRVQM